MREEGLKGQVIVGDINAAAPARYSGDAFLQLPPVTDADYPAKLRKICTEKSINLALSLNDYENSLWAELGLVESQGTKYLCLSAAKHKVVEDKLATYRALSSTGLQIPPTVSAVDVLNGSVSPHALGNNIIIKNRFGSGSYGLQRTDAKNLLNTLMSSLGAVKDERGRDVAHSSEAAQGVVLQAIVEGSEYGVDVVNDFQGRYVASLARKKLGMRDGETSSATAIDSEIFAGTAKALSKFTRHMGLIDTDIIVDSEGQNWLIDINPRFGGGYPFSHFAGANVPRAYVRWASGISSSNADLMSYIPGVTSHKTISLVGGRSAE
jgi:carbamoyl-phosphate synthase large subunit